MAEERVLLVTGHATGGVGAHVSSLARGLPGLGLDVTVFTSALTASRFDLGPRVIAGWPPRNPGTARSLRALLAAADVVHAHGHQAGFVATATAATLPASRRPPVVVSWHNAVLRPSPGTRFAERAQARRADLVAGASRDLVQRARALGAVAELAEVAAPPFTAVSGTPGRGRVLTVSRISPQKRLDVLVDAAGRVAGDVPDLDWRVAGDGDDALLADLQARIRVSGAPVRLLGARDDVPDLMASADVFVLSSGWEARSLAVQEAMAAGLPIVASDVGGLPDLLAPDAGLLVPPLDPAALARAVVALLTDRELATRLGQAARRRYNTLPTESDVLAAWVTRYGRLAAG